MSLVVVDTAGLVLDGVEPVVGTAGLVRVDDVLDEDSAAVVVDGVEEHTVPVKVGRGRRSGRWPPCFYPF